MGQCITRKLGVGWLKASINTRRFYGKKQVDLVCFKYQEKPRKVCYDSKKHITSGDTPWRIWKKAAKIIMGFFPMGCLVLCPRGLIFFAGERTDTNCGGKKGRQERWRRAFPSVSVEWTNAPGGGGPLVGCAPLPARGGAPGFHEAISNLEAFNCKFLVEFLPRYFKGRKEQKLTKWKFRAF